MTEENKKEAIAKACDCLKTELEKYTKIMASQNIKIEGYELIGDKDGKNLFVPLWAVASSILKRPGEPDQFRVNFMTNYCPFCGTSYKVEIDRKIILKDKKKIKQKK